MQLKRCYDPEKSVETRYYQVLKITVLSSGSIQVYCRCIWIRFQLNFTEKLNFLNTRELWYRGEHIQDTNVYAFLKQRRSDYATTHPCKCNMYSKEFPPPCITGSNHAESGVHDNNNDMNQARRSDICECPCYAQLVSDTCLQEDPRFCAF